MVKTVTFEELFPGGHPHSLMQLPDLKGKYMPFMNEGQPAPTMGIGATAGGFTGCPKCGKWIPITLQQKEGEAITCACGEEFTI